MSQPVAGYPAIRVGGGFHFWVGYTGDDMPWGWTGEERHRCACEGSAGMTRCMLRATQEDLLCDACRATEGHGVSS